MQLVPGKTQIPLFIIFLRIFFGGVKCRIIAKLCLQLQLLFYFWY